MKTEKSQQSDIEILLKKVNGDPFVIKKDGEYFIEMVRYTDDPKILLDAIANVKAVDYHTMVNADQQKDITKENFWQYHFDYQYNNGGLVMWENPTEIFEQHLARHGKSTCPTCGGTRIMYYRPICPKCHVPEKDKRGRYSFFEIIYCIAAKNNIDSKEMKKAILDCDHFDIRNDSVVDFFFVENEKVDKYLRMIDTEYPLSETNFFVSW